MRTWTACPLTASPAILMMETAIEDADETPAPSVWIHYQGPDPVIRPDGYVLIAARPVSPEHHEKWHVVRLGLFDGIFMDEYVFLLFLLLRPADERSVQGCSLLGSEPATSPRVQSVQKQQLGWRILLLLGPYKSRSWTGKTRRRPCRYDVAFP